MVFDRRLRRAATALSLAALAASASGCAALGNALGVNKNPPDEFAIVTKAPLVVPPDFALRPPRPGEARPQEASPSAQARVALFGQNAAADPSAGQPSLGEQVLMRDAGVLSADPNIRALIDGEAGGLANKETSFANQLIFWRTDGMEIDDELAPLLVDNPEEWNENRRDMIRRAIGEDAQVTIRRGGAVSLPGVF